jgi:transcriptional regulator with XRE-family HTH domain
MVKKVTTIEEWQSADAARLKALFEAREPKISQTQFGEDFHIGTQGMVWQYMSGTRPLNIDSAMKFARGLGVTIDKFSPTIADQIADAFGLSGRAAGQVTSVASVAAETVGEMRLLTVYRLTDDDGRSAIDALIDTLARRVDASREGKHAPGPDRGGVDASHSERAAKL